MNYYAEWWENARNSTGILTKQTYLKQLERELEQLKSGKAYQELTQKLTKAWQKKRGEISWEQWESEGGLNSYIQELEELNAYYQHLTQEKDQWKNKQKKTSQELTESKQNIAKLTKENQQKDQTITDLQEQIKDLESKYLAIKSLSEQRLTEQKNEYEVKLKTATSNQASLLKTNLFQGTELKQLTEKLASEKEKVRERTNLNSKLQKDLTTQNFLLSRRENQLQELKNLLTKIGGESQQLITEFLAQKRTELETIRNTTKKPTTQLRREVEQLETLQQKITALFSQSQEE